MKHLSIMLTVAELLFLIGCAGFSNSPASFQSVDLKSDLDAGALARYQKENDGGDAAVVTASGQGDCHLRTLEHANGWPLGLVLYWRRGSVQDMHAADGRHYYQVTQAHGFGPLAVLYASREQAVYGLDGKRQSYMDMDSIGWGHVAMLHDMGMAVGGGPWMEHRSLHLFHHFLNLNFEHGTTSVSLFSAPNPVGIGE